MTSGGAVKLPSGEGVTPESPELAPLEEPAPLPDDEEPLPDDPIPDEEEAAMPLPDPLDPLEPPALLDPFDPLDPPVEPEAPPEEAATPDPPLEDIIPPDPLAPPEPELLPEFPLLPPLPFPLLHDPARKTMKGRDAKAAVDIHFMRTLLHTNARQDKRPKRKSVP